ncbi:MAG: hypothetical protein AAB355_02575 [Patescibacteria group bacterium]
MSIKLVKEEIGRFISGTESEIFCISGKWGVGKTYSWNYFLKSAKDAERIGLKRYAYVSLFGLKSLNELKYALYEATKPVEKIGEDPEWEDFELKNTGETFLRRTRLVISRLSQLPIVQGYIGLTESILFYFVGKQLICIDDLERAGNGLDVMDVFGLISFLKEQRHCKVVLLLNKDEIDKEQRAVFDKQFEKVIDEDLQFSPTPQEAADIVFPQPEGIKKDLHRHCLTLGVINIRVIKKIEKIAFRLEEILKDKYADLLYQAIHSSTLFAWSKYQKDKEPPPFDFLTNISRLLGLFLDKEKATADDQRWKALMAEYKFGNVDDFDLVIYDAVQSGIFDKDVLLAAAEKQRQGVTKNKQEQVIHDTWDLYHGSFDDNESGVMDQIFKVSLENIKVISPSNLEGTISTLKEFDRKKEAAELIKKYIDERGSEKELFDLKNDHFSRNIKDPDILREFGKKRAEFVDNRNPADVLETMVMNRGWSLEDEELIDKLSTDDFYKIFKGEKGDRMHRVIRGALQLNRKESDASKELGSISERAVKALEKIAGESRLNARRVAAQGIKLKD